MKAVLLGFAVLCVAACQPPITQTEKQQLAAPVNCATAEGDLRALEAEKVHVGKQILEGVPAFTPVGLVAGAATGTEKEKVQVASGDYNKMLDQKIVGIKTTCGIQ
jgi:hypothetical protein